MSDTVVWIYDDALRPTNAALAANAGAPAIYVFDDAYLAERRISLKRVTFVYECLLEMPVTIRRGDVATEVAAFAAEHGATRVATTESGEARHKAICDALRKALPDGGRLEFIPDVPFAAVDTGRLDLKRFTRYWSMAKPFAMKKRR
jgi:hypothetical protein